ncbi:MAG: non-canonical purine NTP pyrophosphatase, partial [Proteobacteria bacterium]|nr:non-canonical purine NTP pyrophosphatase [Pseudomonadota bacterium]
MKTIVFASRNRGKVQEIQAMMADVGVTLRSLAEYPDLSEVVEDGASFLENALKKARTTAEFTGEIALADDSGLEVDALNGAPGIYSSRYAGDGADDAQNNRKLLNDLGGVPAAERGAAFRCVLVLYRPD